MCTTKYCVDTNVSLLIAAFDDNRFSLSVLAFLMGQKNEHRICGWIVYKTKANIFGQSRVRVCVCAVNAKNIGFSPSK